MDRIDDAIKMDTAGRDFEAAMEDGETRGNRYLEAADLRKEIAEIDLQLHQNGIYIRKEKDPETGEPVETKYDAAQAERLKNKLTLEAERMEGYPWSERSHKGLMAIIAQVVRAVKYMLDPVYRDQIQNLRHSDINEGLRKTAETLIREEKGQKTRDQEPNHETKEQTKDVGAHEQESGREGKAPTQKKQQTVPILTEAEQAKVEEIRQNIHVLNNSSPETITPAVAKAVMKNLTTQAYAEAKEQGKEDEWEKKESWRFTNRMIREHPVLAKGFDEKEAPRYATNALMYSPKSAEYFDEKAIIVAVPQFLSRAERDTKNNLDRHISWIKRDAKDIPVLNAALTEIERVQKGKESGEYEQNMGSAQVQEGQLPGQEPVQPPPMAEQGVEIPAMPDAAFQQEPPLDNQYVNQEYQYVNPDWNEPFAGGFEVSGDPMNIMNPAMDMPHVSHPEPGQVSGQVSWTKIPSFETALRALFAENEFARYAMDPESQKCEVLARNPELLQDLPMEELSYSAVTAAVLNDLSTLRYVPEDICFVNDNGDLITMDDLKNDIMQTIPDVARNLSSIENISMQDAMEYICRDPREEGAEADRWDVAALKADILDDFRKNGESWDMGQEIGGQER
ncbi:MAG: hypothetical protein LUE86_10180 [Clostridiales bacterium]|nr:hypothetical protein [Clostridiales bacterium]